MPFSSVEAIQRPRLLRGCFPSGHSEASFLSISAACPQISFGPAAFQHLLGLLAYAIAIFNYEPEHVNDFVGFGPIRFPKRVNDNSNALADRMAKLPVAGRGIVVSQPWQNGVENRSFQRFRPKEARPVGFTRG